MNVTTTHVGPVVVLRVQEARLTYPILADFATVAANHIAAGEKQVVLGLDDITRPGDQQRVVRVGDDQ